MECEYKNIMADLKTDAGDGIEKKEEDQPIPSDPSTEAGGENPEEGGDAADKGDEKVPVIEEKDIPSRGSANLQHIITRKNETIDKLRKKGKTKEEEEDGAGEGDDLPEDTATLVNKSVDEALAPLKDKLVSDSDNKELEKLLVDEPDAKKYEKAIRVYMVHPSYSKVPVSTIYHDLAFKESQKIGADKRAIADKEAEMNGTGGNTHRQSSTSGLPSIEAIGKMSEKQVTEMQEKIIAGEKV